MSAGPIVLDGEAATDAARAADRIVELEAWAISRITYCCFEEAKGCIPPDLFTERRTLEAVLRILYREPAI